MKGTEKLKLQLSTQCSLKNFNFKVKRLLQIKIFIETYEISNIFCTRLSLKVVPLFITNPRSLHG